MLVITGIRSICSETIGALGTGAVGNGAVGTGAVSDNAVGIIGLFVFILILNTVTVLLYKFVLTTKLSPVGLSADDINFKLCVLGLVSLSKSRLLMYVT